MQNKPTVTIGIPAYNEEANIKFLLEDLLGQSAESYVLENIVVASDASTDKTNAIVKSFTNNNVVLIENDIRMGQAAKQNQIIQKCDSDILVLLNADILIEGKDFTTNLIKPIIEGADLASGKLLEIQPQTFFEKIITVGAMYRREVFENLNSGINLFTCHGSHRAFSKSFYKNFTFQGSVAEDAYSYLKCIKMGKKYGYAKTAVARVKLPASLKDHMLQSTRFFSSKSKLNKYFEQEFLQTNYSWPTYQFIYMGIKNFIKQPLMLTLYILICVYTVSIARFSSVGKSDVWVTSQSSKVLRT